MTDAWHSAKIRQFERVMAGPSIALLRVAGKTMRRRAGSTQRPTLVADTGQAVQRFVAIPSPPDARGIVRAAYSVPAEIVTDATIFSLDLGDGETISLPTPVAGPARVMPSPREDEPEEPEPKREATRADAAPADGNERRGDPIDKLVELSAALADAEQALTDRASALAAAEADLAAADDRARGLELRIGELESNAGERAVAEQDESDARAGVERARAEAVAAAELARAEAEQTRVEVEHARAEAQAAIEHAQAEAQAAIEHAQAEAQAAIEQAQADAQTAAEQARADAQVAVEQAQAEAKTAIEHAQAEAQADAQAAIERAGEELDARIAEAQAGHAQRADEAERQAAEATARAVTAEELVESLRRRTDELEAQVAEQRERIEPLEAELETARTALAHSERERDDAVDEMRKMARERDELSRQAAAFDAVAIKARERANEAEAARDTSAGSLQELEVWRGELERRLTATTTELAAMTAAHKEDSRELKRLRGALAEAEARLELGQVEAAGPEAESGGAVRRLDEGAVAREAILRARVSALVSERDDIARRAEQLTALLEPSRRLAELAADLSRAREHAESIHAAAIAELPGPDESLDLGLTAASSARPEVDRAAELEQLRSGAEAEAKETAERELAEASRGLGPAS